MPKAEQGVEAKDALTTEPTKVMVLVNTVILGHYLLNALKSSYPMYVTKFTEILLNMQHVKSKRGTA